MLVEAHHTLKHRAAYMNSTWFTMRAVIYFVIWIGLAAMLRKFSLSYDRDGDESHLAAARPVAALGLVVLVVTMTLASFDWILSKVAGRDPIAQYIHPKHLNDLGNLMLTLVILWAYMSFAQLLIMWMGNTKEDVSWYVQRGLGYAPNGWRYLAVVLVLFHFYIPFFILLIRENKRQYRILGALAGWLLLMRALDVYWWVAPAGWFDGHAHAGHAVVTPADEAKQLVYGRPTLLDVPAVLTLFGIWIALFVRNLKGKSLLARGGPSPVEAGALAH